MAKAINATEYNKERLEYETVENFHIQTEDEQLIESDVEKLARIQHNVESTEEIKKIMQQEIKGHRKKTRKAQNTSLYAIDEEEDSLEDQNIISVDSDHYLAYDLSFDISEDSDYELDDFTHNCQE